MNQQKVVSFLFCFFKLSVRSKKGEEQHIEKTGQVWFGSGDVTHITSVPIGFGEFAAPLCVTPSCGPQGRDRGRSGGRGSHLVPAEPVKSQRLARLGLPALTDNSI